MTLHGHDHERSAAVSNRVKGLVAKLEQAGITTETELDALVELFLLSARPENGYAIVARAWTNPRFKAHLLDDANAAIASMGIDLSQWAHVSVRVVENTPENHNLIVCTLCSCYPIALLGPSPTWYKSEAYRSRVVRDPRWTLREFGFALDPAVMINVWDASAESRYMVLPRRPAGTGDLDEQALTARVTRNGLIGVAPV
jgi:nitrile hydratase subunit alpha